MCVISEKSVSVQLRILVRLNMLAQDLTKSVRIESVGKQPNKQPPLPPGGPSGIGYPRVGPVAGLNLISRITINDGDF